MLEMMFSYLAEEEIAAILKPFMDDNGKSILEDFLRRWEKTTKDRIDSKLAKKIAENRQFRLQELNKEYELTTF